MRLKKVTTLLMAVIMTSVTVLAGCGKSGGGDSSSENAKTDDGKIIINYLNGFTGGDGGNMRAITDGFNESQDKYEVVEIQDKDHYTKFKSGDYDLVVIHGIRLATYENDEMIEPIEDIYEMAGLTTGDFDDAGIDTVTIDGSIYAFPLDIHPLTMYYNKQYVEEAPETYDDLKALHAEVQGQDSNLYAFGIPGLGLQEYYYMSLAYQNDVELLSDDGEYLNFATDDFADVLLQLNKMIYEDEVSPANLGLDDEFKSFVLDEESGTSAQTVVSLSGPWFYGAVAEKWGDDLGVGSVPVLGEHEGVYGGAHTLAVAEGTSDEVKEGIAEFMKYMFQPDVLKNWADAGQAPLHKETMEYIRENPEEYPLPVATMEQFDSFNIGPKVYNVIEQLRYINDSVFYKVVSEENLTKEDLMPELETATKQAKQIAEEK